LNASPSAEKSPVKERDAPMTMGCLVLGLGLEPPLPPPPEEQAARIVMAAAPAAMGKNRVCLGLIARLLLPLTSMGQMR
jgi:hypothetical protein